MINEMLKLTFIIQNLVEFEFNHNQEMVHEFLVMIDEFETVPQVHKLLKKDKVTSQFKNALRIVVSITSVL